MSEEQQVRRVIRMAEASYIADVFEQMFVEECVRLGVDPSALAPGDSPIFFLAAASAQDWGSVN